MRTIFTLTPASGLKAKKLDVAGQSLEGLLALPGRNMGRVDLSLSAGGEETT